MEMQQWIDKGYELIINFGPRVLGAIVIWFIGSWVIKLLLKGVEKGMKKGNYEISLQKFLLNLLNWAFKIVLIIVILGTVGIETTSFAAILASAGLAVGLALQGSLANFAGGILLMIFKPFKVGDYIEAQGTAGSVREIQIFTTKLTSPDNKEIIIPNGKLSNDNIVNYSAMDLRRIDFVFGVGYDSDIKQTRDILMEQLTSHPLVLEDPAPLVRLSAMADSSLNFNVRPWVKNSDYWSTYYDIMESTKQALDAAGIDIPYPHQVHIRKED
ncbi:mechanosensitive ion channel family protein [Gelidibacter japonicus]|jgi:small conductance mechanosensitive channel|uniref:mechanosensitive ion channel family protein n=1 Tax=Gelidibacter japonicus TaxID=1962232 RepID=UPI0013D6AEF9|nr:mechanosensitive ion channel domain-containing protein [Gelidibacter japonicus]MCL8007959.1 mechanosensitive ion channel [Gelidibacter japonicus]